MEAVWFSLHLTLHSPHHSPPHHTTPRHVAMATESRRIAVSDPHMLSPPRFVVGGQLSHTASGDVKLYEWDREVSAVSV